MMLLIISITTIFPASLFAFDISEDDKLGNDVYVVTGDELIEVSNTLKEKDNTIAQLEKELSYLKEEVELLESINKDLEVELYLSEQKIDLLESRVEYYKGTLKQNDKAYQRALEEANNVITNKDTIIELERSKSNLTIVDGIKYIAVGFAAGVVFNEFK